MVFKYTVYLSICQTLPYMLLYLLVHQCGGNFPSLIFSEVMVSRAKLYL